MSVPGFTRTRTRPARVPAGDRLLPQEISCESVVGQDCRWSCEGLESADYDCYGNCVDQKCRYWDELGVAVV
ncbi:hypothetical protein GCM10010387_22920 [Streptomyces inusitatus]|uniref:Uncharacterized protein n=1 Tax=Streptomyces inusitatus TaxID=68221 RepID=A0A918Q333_9ACTN|nr:hypothetical protein [Streptomyces inusitatus]GGZ29061.1 hypothetical protein GCM10010387_22920 [Streptomyces inusitatus]